MKKYVKYCHGYQRQAPSPVMRECIKLLAVLVAFHRLNRRDNSRRDSQKNDIDDNTVSHGGIINIFIKL
jgi:hypothetical protein